MDVDVEDVDIDGDGEWRMENEEEKGGGGRWLGRLMLWIHASLRLFCLDGWLEGWDRAFFF